MIAAGIEGGRKRAIEDEWDLHDVAAQRAHWRQYGPPPHIGIAMLAAAWGAKLTSDEPVAVIESETRENTPEAMAALRNLIATA